MRMQTTCSFVLLLCLQVQVVAVAVIVGAQEGLVEPEPSVTNSNTTTSRGMPTVGYLPKEQQKKAWGVASETTGKQQPNGNPGGKEEPKTAFVASQENNKPQNKLSLGSSFVFFRQGLELFGVQIPPLEVPLLHAGAAIVAFFLGFVSH